MTCLSTGEQECPPRASLDGYKPPDRCREVNHSSFPPAVVHLDLISSVSEVMAIDTELVQPIAERFNLSLIAFGNVISDPSVPYYGSAVLSNPWGTELEPAPVSPYKNSVAYNILSGTIKNVYNAHRGIEGNDNIKVYPSYMTGNTGTTNRYCSRTSDELTPFDRHQILLEVVGEHLSVQSCEWYRDEYFGNDPHRKRE